MDLVKVRGRSCQVKFKRSQTRHALNDVLTLRSIKYVGLIGKEKRISSALPPFCWKGEVSARGATEANAAVLHIKGLAHAHGGTRPELKRLLRKQTAAFVLGGCD